MKEDRNVAVPAVPAASTKGSTGRQQVAAAKTLPTAESAAASVPFEEGLPVVLMVSVFMEARFPTLRTNRIIDESGLQSGAPTVSVDPGLAVCYSPRKATAGLTRIARRVGT